MQNNLLMNFQQHDDKYENTTTSVNLVTSDCQECQRLNDTIQFENIISRAKELQKEAGESKYFVRATVRLELLMCQMEMQMLEMQREWELNNHIAQSHSSLL